MISPQFALHGFAQAHCAVCGHARGLHDNSEGPCSVSCGCIRWTAPVGWDLLDAGSSFYELFN
jgi:hypothetical protein